MDEEQLGMSERDELSTVLINEEEPPAETNHLNTAIPSRVDVNLEEGNRVQFQQIRDATLPSFSLSHDGTLAEENGEPDNVDGSTNVQQYNPIKLFLKVVAAVRDWCMIKKQKIKLVFEAVFILGLTAYTVAACRINLLRAVPLLVIYGLFLLYKVCALLLRLYGSRLMVFFHPSYKFLLTKKQIIVRFVNIAIILAVIVLIGVETSQRPTQFLSGCGYFVIMFLIFITSTNPIKVKWRPVVWGSFLQWTLALISLRTQAGLRFFQQVGDFMQTFINFIEPGTDFVFGTESEHHFFAFRILPTVIYLNAFLSILYFLGFMEWIIIKIAWLMQFTLSTSATESTVAAGSIFMSVSEAPLLIRPYIDDLTSSELYAVMVSGFGTIAASVLGAYLSLGINPVYVISSCFMAAPCALAVAKLSYPETENSKFTDINAFKLGKTGQRNIIEAAFIGASEAIPIILNIAASIIAFLSILHALNGFLSWFGGLVDFPKLSFEFVCSYLFLPVAYLMGIEKTFTFKAAELLGVKLFLNEFISYQMLSKMLKLRDSGTVLMKDPVTGELNWVNERTEAILTYAMCGFANIGSTGILLGSMGALTPNRIGEVANLILRALAAGFFVSILNACIAGLLYVPHPIFCDNLLSAPNWTTTEVSRLFSCCGQTLTFGSKNANFSCKCCNYMWNVTNFTLNCDIVTSCLGGPLK